jgi:zeaxanthin glucosyltransferase
MTLLVISPDYASHLFPLITLASAWRQAGERVVVATGSATAGIVEASGFERVDLRLGRGSNPGTIKAEDQPTGEDDALRGFFAATRRGMVETLRFQAEARSDDLLWEPVETARAVQRILDEVRPDQVIVDHLAFSARLALLASGTRHADVVLGHPSALPVGDEVYGFPPAWPAAFEPEEEDLDELHALCVRVRDRFTAQWNDALAVLAPSMRPSRDAFAEAGDVLLLNYPEELHDPDRSELLPPHAFIGSAVRREAPEAEVQDWIDAGGDPIVYVSLGSFLSVRDDVLARIAAALRDLDVRVALATGSTDRAALGDIPSDWLVRPFLPQVTLLGHADLAVTHGGNNSVTEAATAGVPMLVLPLSTDQFAGAAALEEAGLGIALAPNVATVTELRQAAKALLTPSGGQRAMLDAIAGSLSRSPGPQRAYQALAGGIRPEQAAR